MAAGVRESILAEAATVEEEKAGGGEEDVASAIATLSVMVRVMHEVKHNVCRYGDDM